jgi:hypothetical protein
MSSKKMGLIPIQKLTEGMVITLDVKDTFGRILINGGQQLRNRHIEILRSHHIEEIQIDGLAITDLNDLEEFNPKVYHIAVQELTSLFILTDCSWEIMKEIHRCAILSKVRALSNIQKT